jgi:hypothetical protein
MAGSTAKKISSIGFKAKAEGVTIGSILRIDADGSVWVDFAGNPAGPVRARLASTMADRLRSMPSGADLTVVLVFENNDASRPVVLDAICDRVADTPLPASVDSSEVDDVRVDGQRVTFDAKKEIVLRCGKSSITLTRAGKVLIRGAYLLNRSSGVNRIKGGSVQIN